MPCFRLNRPFRVLLWGLVLLIGHNSTVSAADPGAVDFNRVIRPILSGACFKCHGPDAQERKAGLRLDLHGDAVKPLESGATAIIPGKPEVSELVRRVLSDDDSDRMPPPSHQRQLTPAEKESLKLWIKQGAEYRQHWSFRPISRPARPAVKNQEWSRNAIDDFVLARLEAAGLKPSPEADRTTLIRRVTLDLTGLPPTPKEIDDFLSDKNSDAYEKLIDRLLKTPQHAERLALDWLDVARYADTNGYHIDNGRDMTRWREWVIDAFAKNMPYDQFTIEQLAGDLLPNATLSQKIASGFNRNHMINFEGGAIPEEYHNAYIVDRVNTTGTVFLGLTVGCAQCHDHKYDPLSQKEYYQLYSFFFNVPENGLDGRTGNAAPLVKAPTPEQQRVLDDLRKRIAALEHPEAVQGQTRLSSAERTQWEQDALTEPKWDVLADAELTTSAKSEIVRDRDGAFLVSGANPPKETYVIRRKFHKPELLTAIRLEVLPHDSFASKGPGRSENGNFVLTDAAFDVVNAQGLRVPAIKTRQDLSVKVPGRFRRASADYSQEQFPVSFAIDDDPTTGWAIHPEVGKSHFAVFELDTPVEIPGNGQLMVSFSFQSKFAQHQAGHIRLSVTGSRHPQGRRGLPENIVQYLQIAPQQRSPEQTNALNVYYYTNITAEGRQSQKELTDLRKQLQELDKTIGTAMVMQEMQQPRDTFVLVRGQYDKKGEKVLPSVPSTLPQLPKEAPANRLGLARWLVSPDHPLMSRVTINRYWQLVFGTGLVKTVEDFGSQGELPSHPELLDWLASEFVHPEAAGMQSWDVRHLLKTMLMSATYRQQSSVTPSLLEKDPENRLLARGPRHRLQVEMIRDQALYVSGLLDRRVGGASVSPYQPAGLWEELMSRADGKNWTAQEYAQSHGADLYRRTMYTFWKRTCPPPSLTTFDAPDRETCTVRRARTNTPLQALVLLNDPTYVEASRKLAERILREGGATWESRITFAFRTVLGRLPKPKEMDVLKRIYREQSRRFAADPLASSQLLSVGESKRDENLDLAELATWTTLSSVLLNLDETVTKS